MPRMVHALAALLAALFFAPAAHAAVSPTASASAAGHGSATATLEVPEGAQRLLAVGVSTLESATVTSVSYGAQVLTREHAAAKDSARAEVWVLTAPNAGSAPLTVTVSGDAPVVVGATSFTGVDPALPVLASASAATANGANSASLVLAGTAEADGMFGVLTVNDAANVGPLTTIGSVDTVVADRRWHHEQGTIAGAGATRRGNTGQNLAVNAGIGWLWTRVDPSRLMPNANVLVGLRAATVTAPTVTSPTATAVTHAQATLGGTLVDTGGAPVTQRGVVFCRCADPALGQAGTTTVDGGASQVTSAFTVTARGLAPATTYTYRAFVTNRIGTAYSEAATFTTAAAPNRPPTASAGGPYAIDEGDPLALAATGSDPEGAELTFAWDLDGDGHFEDAVGATPTLTPAQLAAFGLEDGPVARSVRVAVSDGANVAASAASAVSVRNVAPTATLAGSTVDEGALATVRFSDQADASPADAAAGFAYEYDLDGDGTFEVKHNVPSVTIAAADGPATHTITGAIVDRDGGRREYSTTVVVRNVAPTLTVTGPEAVASSGAVTLTVAASDADPLTGTIDWGDGTVVPFTAGDVEHTYTAAGPHTVTVRVVDKDGAGATATHTVTVAAVLGPHIRPEPSPTATPAPPAAPTPAPPAAGGVLGTEASNLKITRVRVTPRCIRTQGLRAVTSAQRRIKVQFRLNAAADVRFTLKRAKRRPGFTKCPPATGVAQKGDRKLPGVYSPLSKRAVTAKRGLNTVTLAATGRGGKTLKPGTYLLTLTAGDVTARTKVWVLAG